MKFLDQKSFDRLRQGYIITDMAMRRRLGHASAGRTERCRDVSHRWGMRRADTGEESEGVEGNAQQSVVFGFARRERQGG